MYTYIRILQSRLTPSKDTGHVCNHPLRGVEPDDTSSLERFVSQGDESVSESDDVIMVLLPCPDFPVHTFQRRVVRVRRNGFLEQRNHSLGLHGCHTRLRQHNLSASIGFARDEVIHVLRLHGSIL